MANPLTSPNSAGSLLVDYRFMFAWNGSNEIVDCIRKKDDVHLSTLHYRCIYDVRAAGIKKKLEGDNLAPHVLKWGFTRTFLEYQDASSEKKSMKYFSKILVVFEVTLKL